jgi:riboflavin kinase/FMN adenylyltransferase
MKNIHAPEFKQVTLENNDQPSSAMFEMPDLFKRGTIAIGNFDGVHRGHQAVLERAQVIAMEAGTPLIALSFEPHPRTLFKPDAPVFRLTPQSMKARVMAAFGVDAMVTIPFDMDMAKTEAEDFVKTYLIDQLAVSHVVVGHDFHFGKDRKGSPEFLFKASKTYGFSSTTIPAFSNENGETVSSSNIRVALEAGDVSEAASLLGYRWLVGGKVQKGKQIGRTLGFPTANIELGADVRLKHGIYAVKLRRADGSLHNGVASFGRRPTFDNGGALFETFIFDFDDDLYSEEIEVSLFSFLRAELKFDGIDPLIKQMKQDEAEARALNGAVAPISALDLALNFS